MFDSWKQTPKKSLDLCSSDVHVHQKQVLLQTHRTDTLLPDYPQKAQSNQDAYFWHRMLHIHTKPKGKLDSQCVKAIFIGHPIQG